MPVPFKKDPTEFNQRTLLATNVFDLLPKDHDCFIYEDIFSQIDTSEIEKKYSIRGQHAYHPRQVTAILIYAYSQGIFSSRKIEKKCSEDLSFMYISHRNCPNFRVLSDFRKNNWDFFKNCFYQTVTLAKDLGMVSLGHVSIDGSKFYANTSKHKAASYKRLKEAEAKLKKEIEKLIIKAQTVDEAEDKIYHNGNGYDIPEELKIKKKRLLKIKKAKKELEQRERKDNPKSEIDDKSQISYADTEAKIMKHKGSFSYCYNGQISVDKDSHIIVGQHLSRNANDKNELSPALLEIKNNTASLPEKITLDNGYISSDNILELSNNKIDGYIAASKGEKEKYLDNYKKIDKSNFIYNNKKDIFICPSGAILKLAYSGKSRTYRAESKACIGCIYKNRCTAKKDNIPTIYADNKTIILATMAEKMKKNSSKKIYSYRKIIVEPVFGQIKESGFRRFNLRGFKKAGGEFSLICTVHNLKKIVRKIKEITNISIEEDLIPVMA